MRIRRLEERVVRQIAAGEVVERPASSAKELVENALDAGATSLEVEIAGGGANRLCVADDGLGMTPQEMHLAIERHTTSKLAREEDLRHVRTLGFRGEALAAICAVSRATIVSRPPGEDAAHRIVVEGGDVTEEAPAARAAGTTVELRDLFFNVPARRKFLQAPSTESRHTLGALRRLTLARADLRCTVVSEGREVLSVVPAGDPAGRVAQVYGPEVAQRLLRTEMDEEGLSVVALLGPPEMARATRADQHLFLCGRPVRPGRMGAAVYQSYGRYLPRGRHPVYFLYLYLDPELVDVNVHPRKEEVRFRAEGAVADFIRRAVAGALGGKSFAPAGPTTPAARGESTAQVWAAADAAQGPAAKPAPELAPKEGPPWRLLGRLQAGYLVVERPEGLELVDQHAAHERVLFERFEGKQDAPAQSFLVPVQIDLPFDRAQALERAIPQLSRLGVMVEPFGRSSFRLRGWPAPLAERQAALGFREPLLAAAELYLAGGEPPLRELWRQVACGAAVKAGEHLAPAEQEALVQEWKACREPARCPHGRPVAVFIPREELDRRVGR
ncbi:MAG: DNA mismatch repair endonuclease MutL [Candidatus Bipolaricaulota bacterium]